MLITKTNPVGIDVAIQKLQTFLHNKLTGVVLWNNATTYKCYGRCYRNKKDTGYIAENYEGGIEYKEVYWDDSLSAVSFFGVSGQIKHDIKEQVSVHLVFFVNLKKLKPAINHRADEEVHKDILQLIGNTLFDFEYTGMEFSIENVLREYPGSRRDDWLKFVDMHPVHCFRLNFDLVYDKNIC